jgi:hypothetical protein
LHGVQNDHFRISFIAQRSIQVGFFVEFSQFKFV